MVFVLDNYDSFTYNLVQYLGELGVAVEVRQKASLVRATDLTVIRVNADKLRRETGWAPHFTLDQTLTDTLAYWRQQR